MSYSIFEHTIADQTWKDLESAATPDTIVLFPFGVIEEHGPHLPLGTDCYMSYTTTVQVKKLIEEAGKQCIIVPPFYWGINKVTGAFPGSFTVRPETMKAILSDLFHCLKTWGFQHIYCFNCHGDPLHINTILDSIRAARKEENLNAHLVVEDYMIPIYHLDPTDSSLLVFSPSYPEELLEDPIEPSGYDLHGGAYETACMNHYYPSLTNSSLAHTLKDTSIQNEDFPAWNEGGWKMRQMLPLGYAGNPAIFDQIRELKQVDQIINQSTATTILQNVQGETQK